MRTSGWWAGTSLLGYSTSRGSDLEGPGSPCLGATLGLGLPIWLPPWAWVSLSGCHPGPGTIPHSTGASLQVRTGFLMNIMGVLLLSLAMNTWAQTIFQLGTFPEWANTHVANATALPTTLANNTFRTL